jgi:glycosyltransferase involved in cell wall biosynthesis
MKILVIVPAYNEEESLPGVIADLRRNLPTADILVVNDGSTDSTEKAIFASGVTVISLPFNLGIGGAMQTGFLYAYQRGYDIAVQFDGDGQHLAKEIPRLVRPIYEKQADLVVGSRFLEAGGYTAPMFRRMGIGLFSFVLSRIIDKRVTDTTSGFRAANRRVIEFFSKVYPEDYPEVESLVLLHRKKMVVLEVPIEMRERTGGKSSITPLRSMYYMIKVLLAVFIDILKKEQ